eukprot:Lithocolla_globosa_v1_NODE_3213_length_1731_cov_8.599045.p1 type:complete len:312 gc:universal NODE_3213_length_1731_cov_8.599045:690-1625(+)
MGSSESKPESTTDVTTPEDFLNQGVQDLILQQNIVSIPPSSSIFEVLELLSKHRIISCPVLKEQIFLGFVSIDDVVPFLLNALDNPSLTVKTAEDVLSSLDDFHSKRSMILTPKTKFGDVLYQLSLHKVHRVAFVDYQEKLIGVVSQSNLFQQIFKYRRVLFAEGALQNHVGSVVNKGQQKKIHSCTLTEPVKDAFNRMKHKDVTALAVVSTSGELVCQLSASDLRGISPETVTSLEGTVEEYLGKRNDYAVFHKVKEEDSLESALELIFTHQLHRLFVVDKAMAPVGVLTLGDFIQLQFHANVRGHTITR